MAEPSAATQSPSISSSSSGAEPSALGGGGSPGACPALGAKSCGSSCAASFPEHPAFLSKKIDQMEIQKDHKTKNPNEFSSRGDKTPIDTEDKFTLLTAQKPPTDQAKAAGVHTYTLSPSRASRGDTVEKDSPESPFEVIIDKAAFDKEFKDSYKEIANNFGSWTAHTPGELSADLTETDDKVFPLPSRETGRYSASALLPRQFSHTTAALEEVSRCVNDMHNFTNEILTWDLVPQVKQQCEKTDYIPKPTGLDVGECNSEIPVVNLKTNTCQKIPVRSVNGNNSITKPTSDWAKTLLPQEKTMPEYLESSKEVGTKGMRSSVQKQDDTLSESPESPLEKGISLGSAVKTVKEALPSAGPRDEMNWQSTMLGETAEADSSGESEDTVIEDITSDMSFENNKMQAEKSVSIPSGIVKADESNIKEIASYHRENKTSKNFGGTISNSEPQQVQLDILGRSPVDKVIQLQVSDASIISEDGKHSNSVSEVAPEKPFITGDNETECSPNVTTPTYLESICGGNVKDIDDSSPEDLVATFSEPREKEIVVKDGRNAFEASSEKKTDLRTTLPLEVLRESSSDVKSLKSKYPEQSKATNENELRNFFPMQSTPVASLDLEQEQLTIRALRELGERQLRDSGSALDGEESLSEETLKQTSAFAPVSSWPQRSYDLPEHSGVKTKSDLGNSRKTVIREPPRVDVVPSLKTELVNKPVLARLLTELSVHDLIFWRDVKKTGFVFGTTLIVLLSLAAFSVISVVSYLILALLSVTISFRVYKSVIQAVQKSEEGHPFKAYLDVDITLSSEAFHNYVNAAMVHINRALKLIIRLFLVEDLVDSLKLAVFMWLMTYVGAVFNGITLLILAELLVFSVPIVYEKYKTQIDHYVGIARDQTKSIVEKVQAKLPGIAKKKAE
ncbi:PREDICTED: reticulon-3 isoform X2 [Elephantulus edwardii]|uniref:reticulon-3 isoform X2 n=1 Tax=Elephantulus edwardii TaxID=28737 RepID=UPI0003F0C9D2|nr:PREDICTED: reticulon-3 isoform X2 [Elephantulus edwardii]